VIAARAASAADDAVRLHAAGIVQVPEALAVGGAYGLTVSRGAGAGAERFALFVMSTAGQALLTKHGFTAPALP
jgi:hypothetical protein